MALGQVAARIEGDVFQGMFFWLEASKLLRPASRVARVVLSIGLGLAVLVGAPTWAASTRQAAAVEKLEHLFAGTNLADYEANSEGAWNDKLYVVYDELGAPTMTTRNTDGVARTRYTWNIYFAVRCVFAEWTSVGFAAVPRSGADCTAPLDAVA